MTSFCLFFGRIYRSMRLFKDELVIIWKSFLFLFFVKIFLAVFFFLAGPQQTRNKLQHWREKYTSSQIWWWWWCVSDCLLMSWFLRDFQFLKEKRGWSVRRRGEYIEETWENNWGQTHKILSMFFSDVCILKTYIH